MRILVGWDSAEELETIQSFLNIGENSAAVFGDAAAFAAVFESETFDVILQALSYPSEVESFALFQRLRRANPDTPVVGAWRAGDINLLAKFMMSGLHSSILRDPAGEYIMLLTTCLEAAHQAVQARRAQILAEKLREEVESVRQLQESVIPNNLPQLRDYKVVARYEPSQIHVLGDRPVVMAGGDYYDAFRLRDDQLVMMLGDAAGHGVKACMSIMTMHTLIGMIRSQTYWDTAEFVNDVNRRLCKSSIVAGDQGGFITLLYCSLDLHKHTLQWTSAGHPIPLLQDLSTNEVRAVGTADQAGLPLVVSEDWTYPSWQVELPPRCRVVLYTDGLEEAFPSDDERHQQFGVQGIIGTLRETADQPLESALDELFAASHRATKGAGRLDDTSIMLLERGA
ncbi:MAG TPA: PP2C family protein-serine/threonine phosphatase [Pirellulaceae bacterium]|nr:PP2C family protein-serine/threonine phosphatase [Pirellulaceae bacterium]